MKNHQQRYKKQIQEDQLDLITVLIMQYLELFLMTWSYNFLGQHWGEHKVLSV